MYNSAEGIIRECWFQSNGKQISRTFTDWKNNFYANEMPIVWVEFPSFKGKPFLESYPKWVPIFFTSMRFESSISIKYIPLKVSYGRTIHKIQKSSI